MTNLIDNPDYDDVREQLERKLLRMLDEVGDKFLDGMSYIRQWGYTVDETGTVPWVW